MPHKIKTRKGLNIPLKGKAEKILIQSKLNNSLVALKPTDFPSFTPKAALKEGDKVQAGSVLFFNKYKPEVKLTSPVSGTLKRIVRGERRKILEFVIEPDGNQDYVSFNPGNLAELSREQVINLLLESGVWPFIRQRPFDVIANPQDQPKAVFISGFDSSPLAPDYDFIMNDQETDFQKGIDVLSKLTNGKIHLTVNGAYPVSKVYSSVKGVELNSIAGPHPAGNVGVQMHHIDPINKGEVVWHVNPQDVLIIGRLFTKGVFDASKIIALTGSEVEKPRYYKTVLGTSIDSFVNGNVSKEGNLRYISGNVLTGTRIVNDGYLGFYHNQITVIPEGDDYEFFGWALPGFKKFSTSRTFFSWLMPGKEYRMNANLHGGKRPFVFTNEYEKVLPMDILPVYLLKAIMVEDIDQMEALGIYEVGEEDFALCEFNCTSKIPVQQTLRKGFDLMIRETS
ncbi:MAG: NADH:ubiquinone reductase (Na(+)-transporting) subunit A [Bacteroidetes bacterium HGW-Bacteroidetes-4]|jgi:Na+-transporting NADH:ubiquinone oxidoreductase subunit A|nr:MAG: NADH:ubiquinone reductase (Na(+)-transporting) subunit A [Bacteroidetes bacterium HGW-Bacteroidetes-4]